LFRDHEWPILGDFICLNSSIRSLESFQSKLFDISLACRIINNSIVRRIVRFDLQEISQIFNLAPSASLLDPYPFQLIHQSRCVCEGFVIAIVKTF
jgi:hypothetical protein